MRSGQKSLGFTIIETMIVLATSAGLILGAFSLIVGSQNRTEFTQSVNSFNQQLSDIINNVSTGYYAKNSKVTCTLDGGGRPLIDTSVDKALGTNAACVYAGRVVQLGVGSNGELVTVWNITVPSKDSVGDDNDKLFKPELFGEERLPLEYGLKIKSVKTETGTSIGSFAVFTLPPHAGAFGSQAVFAYAVHGTAMTQTEADLKTQFHGAAQIFSLTQPPSGVTVCLDSGTTDQSAVLEIGGTEAQATTRVTIKDGLCP